MSNLEGAAASPGTTRTATSDRDAGMAQGVLLACVPPVLVATLSCALPVLPEIIKAFPDQPHIAELVPLVAVMPILAVALTSIAAGVLGEKIGRRRLLIFGAAVFALSAMAPLWANSFALLLISRAVAGMALGAMLTSAVGLTGDYFSGATLQKWLGAQVGMSAILGVVVSAASGALGEMGWRFAFLPLLVGIPLFIALLATPAPTVQSKDEGHPTGRQDSGPPPWGNWLSVFSLAVVGAVIIFPPNFEFGILLHEKGLGTSSITGLGIAVISAASAVTAFSMGVLRRLSAPAKGALAITAAGAGTLLIAQATTLPPLLIGAAMVGVGQGLLPAMLQIWLLEGTPDPLRGRAVGLYQTVTALSIFSAPLIARWAAISLSSSSAALRYYVVADAVVVAALLLRPLMRLLRRLIPVPAAAE